jgi:hypothetical protein
MEIAIYDEATGDLIVREATPEETAAWEKQKAEAIKNDPNNV